MKIVGIICEYNPIHNGHIRQIAATRAAIGDDAAIVCVMSGNFVQRGDIAVFQKHARAAAAIEGGADLVLELPLPYVLSSAENFALGGVRLLNALGSITHLSFGSEAGEIGCLQEAAHCLKTDAADVRIREELKSGASYAAARYLAAQQLMGKKAEVLKSPNNILAVEYLKAIEATASRMTPVTVRRIGSGHDTNGPESASHLRGLLKKGFAPWDIMPEHAAEIYKEEIACGRGPVFIQALDTALLSRLRLLPDDAYHRLPDATEGLGDRLRRYARTMPTFESVLKATKTKRYALSRLRRMALCAVLSITKEDVRLAPPYIRVLALGNTGRTLLREFNEKSSLPVITKPAAVKSIGGHALSMFQMEAAATDFYVLACPEPSNRTGGQEWIMSPRFLHKKPESL